MGNEVSAGAGQPGAHNVSGITPHWFKRSVAVADIDGGDETRPMYQFGPDTFLKPSSLRIELSDMGASAWVWDLTLADKDGVADTVLISGSVVGVVAGHDVLDDIDQPLIDVSNKFLCLETTTGMVTPVVGTVEVYCETVHGVNPASARLGV